MLRFTYCCCWPATCYRTTVTGQNDAPRCVFECNAVGRKRIFLCLTQADRRLADLSSRWGCLTDECASESLHDHLILILQSIGLLSWMLISSFSGGWDSLDSKAGQWLSAFASVGMVLPGLSNIATSRLGTENGKRQVSLRHLHPGIRQRVNAVGDQLSTWRMQVDF